MKIQAIKMVRKIRDDYYHLLKNRTHEERKAFFHELAEKVNHQARKLTEIGTANKEKPIFISDSPNITLQNHA